MSCFGDSKRVKSSNIYIVELLDGSNVTFHLQDADTGAALLERVWNHLDLFERDYFGIRFLNTSNKTSYWLDGQKNLKKQLKSHGVNIRDAKFYFGVKFYAVDPCKLREELTRYQFFLQLRRDVATGRIPLNFSKLSELGSLVAQSEFGDYERNKHKPGYLHSLKLTSDRLSDDLNTSITELHRDKLRGVLPSQCEYTFLDIIKNEDIYGVEFYNTKDSEGAEYKVGVSPHGIVIYRGKLRSGLYHWPRIDVINFKGKEIIIQVRDKFSSDISEQSYTCPSSRVCKQLWKSCVEHHSFFRLTESKNAEERTRSNLFKLGSKYRYSGRTEKELVSEGIRPEQPAVQRPLNQQRSNTKSSENDSKETKSELKASSAWIGKQASEANNGNGMFTSGAGSPASVRSLKLKFHSKNSDVDAELNMKSRTPRTPRSHKMDLEKESLRSGRSDRRRHSQHYDKSYQHKNALSSGNYEQETSTSRIVRGYIPTTKSNFYPSDLRRHSDRQLSTKWREYENIVYNDEGLPVILATHRGEKADEKMPFYQQSWLHGSCKSNTYSKEPAVASILEKPDTTISNGQSNYMNDPLLLSLLDTTKKTQDKRKTSLSFYEEKLMNRDSGTDSPTTNYYEDHNIYSLIQSLGKGPAIARSLAEMDISTKYGGLGGPSYSPTSPSALSPIPGSSTRHFNYEQQQSVSPSQGTKSSPVRVTVI